MICFLEDIFRSRLLFPYDEKDDQDVKSQENDQEGPDILMYSF